MMESLGHTSQRHALLPMRHGERIPPIPTGRRPTRACPEVWSIRLPGSVSTPLLALPWRGRLR
jgi:hypothetical protein